MVRRSAHEEKRLVGWFLILVGKTFLFFPHGAVAQTKGCQDYLKEYACLCMRAKK